MHTKFKRMVSTTKPRPQQGGQDIRAREIFIDSGSEQRQWECLDLDVVFVVLDKLLEPIDRVSFGVVCKEWSRLATTYKQWCKREVLHMLLVPIDYDESSQEWCYGKKKRQPKHQGLLYSLSERRIYSNMHSIVFPCKPRDRYCTRYYRGCGYGWVAMIDFPSESMITLVNPFTTAVMSHNCQPSSICFGGDIPKVIFSEDPTSNPNKYAGVAFSDNCSTVKVKGRKGGWYDIDCRTNLAYYECRFTDAIFYRGQIYMADCSNCGILVIDYQHKTFNALATSAVVQALSFQQRAERAYLVESIKGDLFHIRRFAKLKSTSDSEQGHNQMVTESFRVYKVVLDGTIVEYVEVKSIGDEAFFVGDSPSVSVLASSSSGCRPNSIYFTDDTINFSLYSANYLDEDLQVLDKNSEVQVDMGVFHLEDGTLSQHHPKYSFDGRLLPSAFWIVPPVV